MNKSSLYFLFFFMPIQSLFFAGSLNANEGLWDKVYKFCGKKASFVLENFIHILILMHFIKRVRKNGLKPT